MNNAISQINHFPFLMCVNFCQINYIGEILQEYKLTELRGVI